MTGDAHELRLTVNGEEIFDRVEARKTLVEFLREDLGLTGSHVGCEHGVCGACTVRVDGAIVRGCLMLAVQCDGCRVETIEGVADSGAIADLQAAFAARNALQCGFCTPGVLLTAARILDAGGVPTREAIRAQLSGNYCRCTGYHAIVDAIETVARARAKTSAHFQDRVIAHNESDTRVTSPLAGEFVSRAARARREGGISWAQSNKHPPPHPSPTRREGADCGSLAARCHSPNAGGEKSNDVVGEKS